MRITKLGLNNSAGRTLSMTDDYIWANIIDIFASRYGWTVKEIEECDASIMFTLLGKFKAEQEHQQIEMMRMKARQKRK